MFGVCVPVNECAQSAVPGAEHTLLMFKKTNQTRKFGVIHGSNLCCEVCH